MSNEIKLVVAKVWQEEQNGTDWVYVKGRNTDTDEGFQTRTFATYKGKATKTAEALEALNKGDYVLLGMKKNGKYLNLNSVVKLTEDVPEDSTGGPLQTGKGASGGSASSGKGGGFRTVPQLNREVALKAAVSFVGTAGVNDVDETICIAREFESFLVGQGESDCCPDTKTSNAVVDAHADADAGDPGVGDDDIPF